MATVIPQAFALRAQIAMFRGSEPAGALLEIRKRRPRGTVRRHAFIAAHDTARITAEIKALAVTEDV